MRAYTDTDAVIGRDMRAGMYSKLDSKRGESVCISIWACGCVENQCALH